jgi:hypothetical protein
VADAGGVVSAEGRIRVAKGADSVRGTKFAVSHSRVALMAGPVLEKAASVASSADDGRGAELAALEQVRTNATIAARESVIRVAGCADSGRGTEHTTIHKHGAKHTDASRRSIVWIAEGTVDDISAFLTVAQVIPAVDAGVVRQILEVGRSEAVDANCGHGAVFTSPEDIGAEEAVTSGVGIVLSVVLRGAVDANGVRNTDEALGVNEGAVVLFNHAESRKIMIDGVVRNNIVYWTALEVSDIILDLEVGFVGV